MEYTVTSETNTLLPWWDFTMFAAIGHVACYLNLHLLQINETLTKCR